jgi:N-acetylglucosamine-6-phosphate deacetylase
MCSKDKETGFFLKNPVSQPILLTNAQLYGPEPLGSGSVLVENGKIVAVGEPVPGVETIDLGGAALGSGLIDLHTHGADGVDLMDGGEAVARMARFVARHGVTGFLPTTATDSWAATEAAIEGVRRAMAAQAKGARVLGVHLEGPFLSPERLGAQSPEHVLPPAPASVARLIERVRGLPCIVTLAPEREGAMEAIRALVEAGVVVSMGHSVCSVEQAQAAFAAGATQVTHLFNGMPPMHHRKPGLVGAALTTGGVRVELIADGVHLHPTTVRLALAAKGVDGVLLVTDSMAATGCADGEYLLGPMKVVVKGGEARLSSGALAGSTLTLERAVWNVARWTAAGLEGAWQIASLNPARQLGLDALQGSVRLGRLVPGYDADLTAIDNNGQVVLTMVRGEIVYRR